MSSFTFKCYRCGKVQSVDRTTDPENKLLKPYNPNEPCGFCKWPMKRLDDFTVEWPNDVKR